MTIELLSVQQNRNAFFDIQIIEKECLTQTSTHKMKGGEGEVWPWIEAGGIMNQESQH